MKHLIIFVFAILLSSTSFAKLQRTVKGNAQEYMVPEKKILDKEEVLDGVVQPAKKELDSVVKPTGGAFTESTDYVNLNQFEAPEAESDDFYGWSVEGGLSFHSVSDGSGPVIGPSVGYQLSDWDDLQLRLGLSVSGAGSTGAYQLVPGWRHYFGDPSTRIAFISDTEVGFNLINNKFFLSLGYSFGAAREFADGMRLGATAGLELATTEISGLNIGGLTFAPRLYTFVGMDI